MLRQTSLISQNYDEKVSFLVHFEDNVLKQGTVTDSPISAHLYWQQIKLNSAV